VLAGEALYLLQQSDLHGIAVAAKAGEFNPGKGMPASAAVISESPAPTDHLK